MLHDILLLGREHVENALAVVENSDVLTKDKYIIGISGESGTGKSELSYEIGKELNRIGILSKIIHLDNYYKLSDPERTDYRKRTNFEFVGKNEYEWQKILYLVKGFRYGYCVKTPCYDLVSKSMEELIVDFSETRVLILDGIYAINGPSVDLKVFIEGNAANQDNRNKEIYDSDRKKVLDKERESLLTLKPNADIIIEYR